MGIDDENFRWADFMWNRNSVWGYYFVQTKKCNLMLENNIFTQQ